MLPGRALFSIGDSFAVEFFRPLFPFDVELVVGRFADLAVGQAGVEVVRQRLHLGRRSGTERPVDRTSGGVWFRSSASFCPEEAATESAVLPAIFAALPATGFADQATGQWSRSGCDSASAGALPHWLGFGGGDGRPTEDD